jgi:hypothetical protein
MSNANSILHTHDRGGRRSGIVRRRAVIPGYDPERRSGQDRRSGQERRSPEQQLDAEYLRRNIDRYAEFSNTHRGVTYGMLLSLPIWVVIIFLIVRQVWF